MVCVCVGGWATYVRAFGRSLSLANASARSFDRDAIATHEALVACAIDTRFFVAIIAVPSTPHRMIGGGSCMGTPLPTACSDRSPEETTSTCSHTQAEMHHECENTDNIKWTCKVCECAHVCSHVT
jgi:hypothetical protein